MPAIALNEEIKILTPIGMLGYSFSEDIFWEAVEAGVDAIILDSGSTDSGPSRLALGQTAVSREAYARDLKILVSACHYHNVPVLIGSAGGDGSSAHVALLVEIVSEIVSAEGFRPMKVVTIDAQIPKATAIAKFQDGRITPCGGGVPPVQQADIDDANIIVAQMGYEPWVKAMEAHPDFDIVIAGRSYDPAPYAAYCVYKGFPDLGLAYHMGKIMECGAVCAVPKSAEALATVRHGSFDILPLDPAARCTPLSVAAHTMYEKSRPDLLAGPGGILDVTEAKYEQLADGKSVRISGSQFRPLPEGEYTIKLEAARVTGYMAIFIGGIRDPIMVAQLDNLVPMIEDRLRMMLPFKFELQIRFYGKDPLVKGLEPPGYTRMPMEVGVLGKVLAPTQEEAKAVANLAKVFFIHAPYPGQVATAGNFMMPFSPCDLSVGPAAEFCLYHLMQVDDPTECFPFEMQTVEAIKKAGGAKGANGVRPKNTNGKSVSLRQLAARESVTAAASKTAVVQLSPPPPPGFVYLANLAKVVRTKNCGPFELTIDVMFPDLETYQRVKAVDILNEKVILDMYEVPRDHLLACMWWEPALAFKATIKRATVNGSFADDDVHGSGWHVPLMYLKVPETESRIETALAA